MRILLPIVAAIFLQACDKQCVGPACTPPDSDTDPLWTPDTDVADIPADDEADPELPRVRSCDVVRLVTPPPGVDRVQIAGAFNGWEPAALTGPDATGRWTADLGPLATGSYAYKYLFDGTWESDPPPSAELQWDGGVENRSLRVGDCGAPLLRTVSATTTPSGTLDVVVAYARGSGGDALTQAGVDVTIGGAPATFEIDAGSQQIVVHTTGLPPGKHSVRVRATDAGGHHAENEPLFVPLWVEAERFVWTDALMYLAFIDRFRDGDLSHAPGFSAVPGVDAPANYSGGDLLGVQQSIEDGWFTDLGVRALWLSPFQDNADGGWQGVSDGRAYSGYHGYWPVAPRAVEPRFGDAELSADERLQAVIDAAHARGIRVVMDVVLNHVHEDHAWQTEHPDWFTTGCVCGADGCGWDDKPLECKFTAYLPDLDHTNPAIVEALVQDVMWWVRTYDLDGLRIDAVKHFRRVMSVDLKHRLLDEVERGGGAPLWLVGETFTGGDGRAQLTERVGPWELDGQFDFPIYWTIRDVFAHGGPMTRLEDATRAGLDTWGAAPMSPFAGNHDVARLTTEMAGNGQGAWGATPDLLAGGGASVTQSDLLERVATALTYTLTQPGVPLLYYGDEIGLAGDGDPDNRRRMSFPPYLSANQSALLARLQAVGQARAELVALRRGGWTPLWAEADATAYARHTDGGDVAIVVISRGGERTLRIPLQGLVPDGTRLADRLSPGRVATVDAGSVTISLSGPDAAILAP